MAYNNLQNRVTSVETASFTNGTGLSYSTIASLTSGVPHVDQLEVERIFDLDTNVTVNGSPVNIQDNISAFDLHKIFILEKADYTLNEATSTLTTITIPGNRTYTIAKAKNNILPVGTVISIPVFSNGQKVIIRRKTLSFDPYVTWTAGTRLTSEQLNLQVQQLLRLNQELIYKMESEYLRVNDIAGDNAPAFDVANSLDMQNNKIINLSDPSSAQDGATKNYVDTALTGYVATTGTQTIAGAKTFSSGVTLSSTLAVTGNTTMSGTLAVTGNTTIGGSLNTTGAVTAPTFSGYGVSPVGAIMAFAGSAAPAGWLLCNGSSVSQTTYAALFAVIGSTYGTPVGGNFVLPDLRGRAVVGVNSSTYLTTLGSTAGSADAAVVSHTHSNTFALASAGDHSHFIANTSSLASGSTSVLTGSNYLAYDRGGSSLHKDYGLLGTGTLPTLGLTSTSGSHTHTLSGSITSTGSSGTNQNLQPSIALNYIIRAL